MCDGRLTDCVVGGVASAGFGWVSDSTARAAGALLVAATNWWVTTPSVLTSTQSAPGQPSALDTVHSLQQLTIPLTLTILVLSVLNQSIRMMLSRRKDPAVNVALGLVRYALVAGGGLFVLQLVLQGSDWLARWWAADTMAQFSQRIGGLVVLLSGNNQFLEFFLGLMLLILSFIQWVLGFIRQSGILVLAVLLPLAASGSINDSTRGWLRKVLVWLVGLVFYKPIAALIYAIGFGMLGTGQDLQVIMTGLMVLLLSVIALPLMMKFFSFAGADSSGGGVGGALIGGAMGATGAMKLAGGFGGGGAVDAAARMERSGPGASNSPAGSGGGLTPTGSSGSPGGPSSGTPGGSTPGTPAGSGTGTNTGAGTTPGSGLVPSGASGSSGASASPAATAGAGGTSTAATGAATGAPKAAGPAGLAVDAGIQAANLAKGAANEMGHAPGQEGQQ